MLPGSLTRLLFWVRCVPLPLVTLWADYAAWVPSSGDERAAQAETGASRTRRHLQRGVVRVRHVPCPALSIVQFHLQDPLCTNARS